MNALEGSSMTSSSLTAAIERVKAEEAGRDARIPEPSAIRRNWAPALSVFIFAVGDVLAAAFSVATGIALVAALGGLQGMDYGACLARRIPFILLFPAGFAFGGLYPGISLAPSMELRRFTFVSFLVYAGMATIDVASRGAWGAEDWAMAVGFMVSIPTLTACRVFVRSRCARSRWWGWPVVVFGAGETGRELVNKLIDCPWIGYRPTFILDDDPELTGSYKGVPVLCGTGLGPVIAERYRIRTAIIAMPGVNRRRVAEIIEVGVKPFRRIISIPDRIGMTSIWMDVRDFEGFLGLSMDQTLLSPWNRAVKRAFELCITLAIAIVLLPLMAVISAAILLDSPGPVFYGHKRIGRRGREFTAYKFRTMRKNSEAILEDHLKKSPKAREEWERSRKLKQDPRVTRVGRFLRSRSLDELPQLLNIIVGEMSLIGPRPVVKEEIKRYGSSWGTINSVRPGISGLWQVSGRSDRSYSERVELDLYYIRNWSLWIDLYIVFKTIWTIVAGKGAY
jgi:Undecaprenyl-phosphate galactose phosphotransferase WbaP